MSSGDSGDGPLNLLERPGLIERLAISSHHVPPPEIPGYEILDEIARGGTGVVYRARELSLKRIVALKVLRTGRLTEGERQEAIKRFKDEPRKAAALKHKNIVQIHAMVDDGDPAYFTMQLVDGIDLARLTKNGPLEVFLAARYAAAIARGIAYAHSVGILHRDLKPQNILIDADDEPRITDFGLAKWVGNATSLRTVAGEVIGTPHYMPPEQAAGDLDEISTRSDVYGIGAVLYHLLTGRPPFAADSIAATIHQVLYVDPVPPRVLNPTVTVDLETVCLKCLEKDADKRYRNVSELAEDLERFVEGQPVLARPLSSAGRLWRWRKRNPVGAHFLLLLCLAILSGLIGVTSQWLRAEKYVRDLRTRLARVYESNASRLLESREDYDALVWSSAAHALFVSRDEKARNLTRITVTTDINPEIVHVLKHAGEVVELAFRPDQTEIATVSLDRRLRRWSVDTGALRAIVELPIRPNRVSYSHGGQTIAIAGDDGVVRLWSTESGQSLSALPPCPSPVLSFAFSPGDDLIATGTEAGAVTLHRTGDRSEIGRLVQPGPIHHVEFSPDGTWVTAAAGSGSAIVWRVGASSNSATILRHPDKVLWAAFEAGSRSLVTSCADGVARLWSLDNPDKAVLLPGHRGPVEKSAFAPDGQRLATAGSDGLARIWEIADGQRVVASLRHPQPIRNIDFSPDGRWVVTACLDGKARIWSAGGQLVCPPLAHSARLTQATFSPAGNLLASASADRTVRIWNLQSREPRVTLFGAGEPLVLAALSPDGNRLVGATANGALSVWEVSTGDTVFTRPGEGLGVRRLNFDAQGDFIGVVSANGGARVLHAATGRLVCPSLEPSSGITSIGFSPGSRLFVTTSRSGVADIWRLPGGQRYGGPLRHSNTVEQAVFRPDGRGVATVCSDGIVRLWDIESGDRSAPIKQDGQILSIRFSDDGRLLATASADTSARLWSAVSALPMSPALRHGSWMGDAKWVTDALPAPDGRKVATLCQDGSVRIWNTTTARLIATPIGHSAPVAGGMFNAESTLLLTWDTDQAARVWDATTGFAISSGFRLGGRILAAAFTQRGHSVTVVCANGLAAVWEFRRPDPSSRDLPALASLYSANELMTGDNLAALHPVSRHIPTPLRPEVSSEERAGTLRKWHQLQAIRSEAEARRFAAVFHLDRWEALGAPRERTEPWRSRVNRLPN